MKVCVATAKFMVEKKLNSSHEKSIYIYIYIYYAPVICMPGGFGAGDTRDITGLKCQNLTFDVSLQCRGCAAGGGGNFPPK